MTPSHRYSGSVCCGVSDVDRSAGPRRSRGQIRTAWLTESAQLFTGNYLNAGHVDLNNAMDVSIRIRQPTSFLACSVPG